MFVKRVQELSRHFRVMKINVAWSVFGTTFCLAMGFAAEGHAQYIGIGLPFQTANESSYERMGVGFNFWLDGSQTGKGVVGLMPNGQLTPDGRLYFSQGGIRSAIPPFGGYDPGADARLGFAYNGSGGGFGLNLVMGKGNTRTLGHTTPSLVVPNGVPGWIYSGQLRPFVTGIYPVLGARAGAYDVMPRGPISSVHPVHYKLWLSQQQASEGQEIAESEGGLVLGGGQEAVDSSPQNVSSSPSSAATAALSVEELTRRREQRKRVAEQERQAKIKELVASAERAVADRYYGAARERLRRAIRLATEQERESLQSKLDALSQKR